MAVVVNWNNTAYSIPQAGNVNWPTLTNFLVALATYAQTTNKQKVGVRQATATPVTVSALTDCMVVVNVASAAVVNLPAGVDGQMFAVVDGSAAAMTNNITITPNGSETVNGAATLVINTNRGGFVLIFRGTNWTVISSFNARIPANVLTPMTPDRAVITDSSGYLTVSPVSEQELEYLVGVTDPIQDQIDDLNKLTTKGDILAYNGTGYVRMPVGTNGQVLSADSGQASGLAYISPLVNPMNAVGDIIMGGASGTPTRLPIGANGTVLKSDGTDPEWGSIVNANIDAAAAIAYSKLALSNSIVNADISSSAAINFSKLENGTALSVLGRSANSSGANASIAAGTDNYVLRRSGTSLGFGLLVNANIDAAAAIAGTKVDLATAAGVQGVVNPYSTSGVIYADTYTPTLTNGTNVSGSSVQSAHYLRLGKYVIVYFYINVNCTSGTFTASQIDISLPIASNFSATTQVKGAAARAAATGTAQDACNFISDSTNDRAVMLFNAGSNGNRACSGTFSYEII